MTFDTHPMGPRADEEEEEHHGTALRTPMVDSKSDRLNPEVEYEVLALSDDPKALKAKLNEMGQDGWQLVSTTPAFIFRRMKRSEEKPKTRVGFSV
ncbi:MAG TPA: hypothetical protein V6D47_06815 [Oscillatoriaceae cyanobacterium]